MKLISIKIPEAMVELLDDLVREKVYPSRSAAIRLAIRDFLMREHPELASGPTLAEMFKR